MWTASPRVRLLLRSLCGPLVSARQFGFEQRSATRAAVAHVTASTKASVMIATSSVTERSREERRDALAERHCAVARPPTPSGFRASGTRFEILAVESAWSWIALAHGASV